VSLAGTSVSGHRSASSVGGAGQERGRVGESQRRAADSRLEENDGTLRESVHFVGRLPVEKDGRDLVNVEQVLIREGLTNFRFLIVGQGAEEPGYA